MNNKRLNIILVCLIVIFLLIIVRIFFLCVIKKDYYNKQYKIMTNNVVYGELKERGKILDINGNIIVDNKRIKRITYKKNRNNNEINIAKELSKLILIEDDINIKILKDYYVLINGDNLISKEEEEKYKKRKISKEELFNIKLNRVSDLDINNFTRDKKEEAYIYYLMNKGYSYEIKIIKDKNVSEKEYANVCENNIDGIICDYTWERYYPYGQTLRSILGTVSSRTVGIPEDLKDYYDKEEYSNNDRVGISYLEQQYDNILRGTKDKYILNSDNTLTLIEEGKDGKNITLSIDINMQQEIDSIVKEEIVNAKKARNTQYYNSSYLLLSNVYDGSIKVLSAWKYFNNNFKEISNTSIYSSFTLGSVVKGASISVGYKYNIIDIGTKMRDSCIKLNNIPEKCSYKNLGLIDDKSAITNSSNYYQFMIAVKITQNEYRKSMNLNVNKNHFDIYRNMFSSYGLGSYTKIDLPNESLGVIGNTISDDLLLNYSIGQYDTYTPVMLLQYINTIANKGRRLSLKLNNNTKSKLLNKIDLEKKYFDRLNESFRSVYTSGTGKGYFSKEMNVAMKTGTSESFLDGISTITTTTGAFFPYNNPKYSIIMINPNISYVNDNNNYKYPINRIISNKISKKVFEYLK